MNRQIWKCALALAAVSAAVWAQPVQGGRVGPGEPGGPPPMAQGGRGTGRGMNGMPGKWWDNPEISARLGVSDEQKKKMDDVFQASRIKLIDLRASLDKEEAMLDPLMQAATPDDSKLLPQIDKVAQARAELEKANARLLLGIRHVLSPQQWQNLQADRRMVQQGQQGTQPLRPGILPQGRGQGGQTAPPPPPGRPPGQGGQGRGPGGQPGGDPPPPPGQGGGE